MEQLKSSKTSRSNYFFFTALCQYFSKLPFDIVNTPPGAVAAIYSLYIIHLLKG